MTYVHDPQSDLLDDRFQNLSNHSSFSTLPLSPSLLHIAHHGLLPSYFSTKCEFLPSITLLLTTPQKGKRKSHPAFLFVAKSSTIRSQGHLYQSFSAYIVYICSARASMFLLRKFSSDFAIGSLSRFIRLTRRPIPATFWVHRGLVSFVKFVALCSD